MSSLSLLDNKWRSGVADNECRVVACHEITKAPYKNMCSTLLALNNITNTARFAHRCFAHRSRRLPGQNIARLRVASDSRFKNMHKARQSFGAGNLGMANMKIEEEEEEEEVLFKPINIKSIGELSCGRTLGTGR